jgi:hypothetical protein
VCKGGAGGCYVGHLEDPETPWLLWSPCLSPGLPHFTLSSHIQTVSEPVLPRHPVLSSQVPVMWQDWGSLAPPAAQHLRWAGAAS